MPCSGRKGTASGSAHSFELQRGCETKMAVLSALGLVALIQTDGLAEVAVLAHTSASAVLGPLRWSQNDSTSKTQQTRSIHKSFKYLMTPEIMVGAGLAGRPILVHVRERGR